MTVSAVDAAALNRLIWRIFTRDNGLTCSEEAAKALISNLQESMITDFGDLTSLLKQIAQSIKGLQQRPVIIDVDSLQTAMINLLNSAAESSSDVIDPTSYIYFVDAFAQKAYNLTSNGFFEERTEPQNVFGSAEDKIRMWRVRFELANRRTTTLLEMYRPNPLQGSQSSSSVKVNIICNI